MNNINLVSDMISDFNIYVSPAEQSPTATGRGETYSFREWCGDVRCQTRSKRLTQEQNDAETDGSFSTTAVQI